MHLGYGRGLRRPQTLFPSSCGPEVEDDSIDSDPNGSYDSTVKS